MGELIYLDDRVEGFTLMSIGREVGEEIERGSWRFIEDTIYEILGRKAVSATPRTCLEHIGRERFMNDLLQCFPAFHLGSFENAQTVADCILRLKGQKPMRKVHTEGPADFFDRYLSKNYSAQFARHFAQFIKETKPKDLEKFSGLCFLVAHVLSYYADIHFDGPYDPHKRYPIVVWPEMDCVTLGLKSHDFKLAAMALQYRYGLKTPRSERWKKYTIGTLIKKVYRKN